MSVTPTVGKNRWRARNATDVRLVVVSNMEQRSGSEVRQPRTFVRRVGCERGGEFAFHNPRGIREWQAADRAVNTVGLPSVDSNLCDQRTLRQLFAFSPFNASSHPLFPYPVPMFGPLPLPVPWTHVQLAGAFGGEELYGFSRNWYAVTMAGVLGVLSRLSGDIVVGGSPRKA